MKELTVSDIRGIFDDCWIWVTAYGEEDELITVFTQSKTNSEIPDYIRSLPVHCCTVQTNNCGNSVVVCEVTMQTLFESGAHIVNNKVTFPFSVYVCNASNFGYDEYDEVTVIAHSETHARQLAEDFFSQNQKPINIHFICECSAKTEHVLTCSFNAG